MRWREGSISKHIKWPDWECTLGQVTFPKHHYYLWYIKSSTEARGVSYMENRFQKSVRARSKHRGNSGAALVSIKPCLLMFLLAEARFGNMDHNTIFIPYKIHCEVMRNGNCWAAPGRSFRKECAFPWEFLQRGEQFSSRCEKKLGSLQGICFTNLQEVENKIPRGEVWEQKFRASFLCVPHWGQTGREPAQDICSLPRLFASYLVSGWDLGLHCKLVLTPVSTADFI